MTDLELAEEIERHGLQVFGAHALTKQEAEQIIAALRRGELAQTEIKGHMRVEDALKAECAALAAGSCVHDLVGDPYGHFECSRVLEQAAELKKMMLANTEAGREIYQLESALTTSKRLHLEASENAHMHYTNSGEWKRKADEAQARIAELEKERDEFKVAYNELLGIKDRA